MPRPSSFSSSQSFIHIHPNQVYVLNGGLEAWKAAGGETESGPAPQVQAAAPSPYKALFKKTMVVDQNQVVTNVSMYVYLFMCDDNLTFLT